MNFLSVPWLWLYAGAMLVLSEIFVPGCVVMFFGAGALVTGLTVLLAVPDMSVTWQMLEFSVVSVVTLVAFRRLFMGALGIDAPKDEVRDIDDGFTGKLATVVEPPKDGLPGRVMLGDAEWSAVAEDAGSSFAPGDAVRVVSRSNLTLKVEKV